MTPAQKAIAELERRAAGRQQEPTAPVTAEGLGKAAITGVRTGAEGVVGGYGDAPGLIGGGVSFINKKLGQPEEEAAGTGHSVSETAKAILDPRAKIALIARWLGLSEETGDLPTMFPTSSDVNTALTEAYPDERTRELTQHQPQNPTEELAHTAGTFAGGALLPGGPMARIARVMMPTLAVEGAGQTARSFEATKDWEPAVRMVAGLIAGGMQGRMEGNANISRALRNINTTPAAADRLRRLLIEQGMSSDEAATAMRELGVGSTPMDVSPVVRQEAQQLQTAGGRGRAIIDPMLRAREAETNRRLMEEAGATVGPREQPTDVVAALEKRKQDLGPEYEAAHAGQTKPAATQAIVDQLDTELAKVKSPEVVAALQRIKKSLHLRDTDQLDPSSEGLHEARMAIDNELYDASGKPRDLGSKTAATLKRYRALIDEQLAEVGPIKDVDVKRSQIGKEERAFDTGQELYENPRGAPTEVEFQRTWEGMSPGEREHVLKGINVETYRQLGINSSDLNRLQSMLKGEGKWNQQKLATVVGDEKASALMRAIQRERTFRETYQKVVQGSKTAESLPGGGKRSFGQAIAEAVPEVVAATALAGPKAGGGSAMSHAVRFAKERVGGGGAGKDAGDVARLLTSTNPAQIEQAIDVARSTGSGLSRAALAALLAAQTGRRQ